MAAFSRRRILGGSAAVALAALPFVAAAASGPDAELIRLCAEFDALERQYVSYFRGGANYIEDDYDRSDVTDPISDEQKILLNRICLLPTRTPEGFRARLRMMTLWAPEWTEELPETAADEGGFWDERMRAAFFRDMLAATAAA
jgi:hypothetical protein